MIDFSPKEFAASLEATMAAEREQKWQAEATRLDEQRLLAEEQLPFVAPMANLVRAMAGETAEAFAERGIEPDACLTRIETDGHSIPLEGFLGRLGLRHYQGGKTIYTAQAWMLSNTVTGTTSRTYRMPYEGEVTDVTTHYAGLALTPEGRIYRHKDAHLEGEADDSSIIVITKIDPAEALQSQPEILEWKNVFKKLIEDRIG